MMFMNNDLNEKEKNLVTKEFYQKLITDEYCHWREMAVINNLLDKYKCYLSNYLKNNVINNGIEQETFNDFFSVGYKQLLANKLLKLEVPGNLVNTLITSDELAVPHFLKYRETAINIMGCIDEQTFSDHPFTDEEALQVARDVIFYLAGGMQNIVNIELQSQGETVLDKILGLEITCKDLNKMKESKLSQDIDILFTKSIVNCIGSSDAQAIINHLSNIEKVIINKINVIDKAVMIKINSEKSSFFVPYFSDSLSWAHAVTNFIIKDWKFKKINYSLAKYSGDLIMVLIKKNLALKPKFINKPDRKLEKIKAQIYEKMTSNILPIWSAFKFTATLIGQFQDFLKHKQITHLTTSEMVTLLTKNNPDFSYFNRIWKAKITSELQTLMTTNMLLQYENSTFATSNNAMNEMLNDLAKQKDNSDQYQVTKNEVCKAETSSGLTFYHLANDEQSLMVDKTVAPVNISTEHPKNKTGSYL